MADLNTPGTVLYYLDDYADEVMPCGPTLDDWAEWLSKPDLDWGRERAAVDGQEFDVSTMILLPDLVATFDAHANRWAYDPPAVGASFFAERYGEGTGWDGGSCASSIEQLPSILRPDHVQAEHGEQLVIAVCRDGARVRVRFNYVDDEPRLVVVSEIGSA